MEPHVDLTAAPCLSTNFYVNILDVVRKSSNQCSCIMITSDKCYENTEWIWGYRENDTLGGSDPYSSSKGAAELIIKSYFHSFFNWYDDSNADHSGAIESRTYIHWIKKYLSGTYLCLFGFWDSIWNSHTPGIFQDYSQRT